MPAHDEMAFVQLKIRMREKLRAQLARAAEQHSISMNAEIVMRLERFSEIDTLLSRLQGQLHEQIKQFQAREAEYQTRINQLTDILIQRVKEEHK
jgi:hypothetical protein